MSALLTEAEVMAAVRQAVPEATMPQVATVTRLATQIDPEVARLRSVHRAAGHRLDPGDVSVAMIYCHREEDAESVEVVTVTAAGLVSDSVDYG